MSSETVLAIGSVLSFFAIIPGLIVFRKLVTLKKEKLAVIIILIVLLFFCFASTLLTADLLM